MRKLGTITQMIPHLRWSIANPERLFVAGKSPTEATPDRTAIPPIAEVRRPMVRFLQVPSARSLDARFPFLGSPLPGMPGFAALYSAMVSELDIYRAANLLLKQHGDQAEVYAFDRSRKLSAKGDEEGSAVWLRIAKAAKDILKREPSASESQH